MKAEVILSRGPWAQLVQIKNALCSDGVRRTTCRLGMPDTAFSVPAAVRVKGKTVTGFVTCDDSPDGREWYFIAYKNGKNGNLLPGLKYNG